jgi:hypothetical protein
MHHHTHNSQKVVATESAGYIEKDFYDELVVVTQMNRFYL